MTTLDKIRQLAPTHSAAEIAIQVGCSRQWVYSAASKAGIPLRPRPLGPYRLRGLSRTVRRAIVDEANRRGVGVVEVLRDLNAHVWDGDVAEMGGGV